MKKTLISLLMALASFSSHGEFKNSSELSTIITGGNSELETYNATTSSSYKFSDKNTLTFGGHYTYGTSAGVESARNWDGNLRYDRGLTEKLSGFFGEKVEGDKFAGIRTRFNSDLGAKYDILKSDQTAIFAESGYRHTVERQENGLPTEQFQKIRFYSEANHKLKEGITGKLWVEYLPNISTGSDWNINIEPSLSVVLSKTFSLKLAYKGQYDNLPTPGSKKYDYSYTTGLLANF